VVVEGAEVLLQKLQHRAQLLILSLAPTQFPLKLLVVLRGDKLVSILLISLLFTLLILRQLC